MRNKLSFRNFALVALVAVALMIGLYGTTNRSKTDGGNGGIALEPPLFISSAEAAETGITAFPADKAGISAYVKVAKAIDLDKVRTIFTKVVDIGDNYIIGIVLISNYGSDTEVHLYADTDGWLVAYLAQEEPAAKIMKWPANYDFSPITKITTTTLRETLNNAGRAAGVRIPADIKYYDFKFPDANAMTLFVKIATNQPAITQVKIPADWMLYEGSYYAAHRIYVGRIWSRREGLQVDGARISEDDQRPRFGMYEGAITPGVLHTIKIGHPSIVATVLIYKTN